MLAIVQDGSSEEEPGRPGSLIGEIVREGARRMLAGAVARRGGRVHLGVRWGTGRNGRHLVVRNGYRGPREVLASAGAVEVTAPRVNGKRTGPVTGERMRFSSAGLSAVVITRLTGRWGGVQRAFAVRELSRADCVYLRAGGIRVSIRLAEHKLCLRVMTGVCADGRQELIALAGGYRESAGSWAGLLRDCACRGTRAPVLAAGDGALGFRGALREVFPGIREQRCWFRTAAHVLDALPQSAHPGAKKALAEIRAAGDRRHALAAVQASGAAYGAKFPAAAAKITGDLDQLLAFCGYPAEHRVPVRTTNPAGPAFATVRHRTKVSKGPGSRAAGLATAFKLTGSARALWHAANGPQLVALARAGARLERGFLAGRHDQAAA